MNNKNAQKMVIHQYHAHVALGDAITNQMFFIQKILQESAIQSEIFASHIPVELREKVLPLSSRKVWDCDVLLLHHSQGNPQLKQVLRIAVPKALVYHNITPPEYFAHDPVLANLSKLGRQQLRALSRHVVTSFVPSLFNASELQSYGFRSPKLIPLVDLNTLGAKQKPTAAQEKHWQGSKDLLFVGRLTPHKNQALLIKMMFYLKNFFPQHYQLTLVGKEDPIYGRYLRLLAKELGVSENVVFTGKIPDSELWQQYSSADAFICVSQHEGFCVPLAEAMSADLPIFALAKTGTKETLGAAGVLLHTEVPAVIAEIVGTTLDNGEYRKTILDSQTKRFRELEQQHNKERIQLLCTDLIQNLRNTPPGRKKCIEKN